MADNIFQLRATKGEPIYQVIQFNDYYNNPMPLAGYDFDLNFRYAYGASSNLFYLTMSTGLGFVNDDDTLGQIYFNITDTSGVAVNTTPQAGIPVPYTDIVGDLKIIAPVGIQAIPACGTRPKIFIRVEAAIT
jgi:hypothetical protein